MATKPDHLPRWATTLVADGVSGQWNIVEPTEAKKDIGIECSEVTAKAFFRTISVPEHRTFGYTGVDAKGEILKHPSALKEAYGAGLQLIENVSA